MATADGTRRQAGRTGIGGLFRVAGLGCRRGRLSPPGRDHMGDTPPGSCGRAVAFPFPYNRAGFDACRTAEALIASTPGIIQANLAPGNVKETAHIAGDIVWSDEKQAGYLRFRGLPINDATATCYQLWIFDEVQDKRTPIDGGIFDVTADGEVIIPINAKLETNGPNMFAITIETPRRRGGLEPRKIAAVAKVETQAS